ARRKKRKGRPRSAGGPPSRFGSEAPSGRRRTARLTLLLHLAFALFGLALVDDEVAHLLAHLLNRLLIGRRDHDPDRVFGALVDRDRGARRAGVEERTPRALLRRRVPIPFDAVGVVADAHEIGTRLRLRDDGHSAVHALDDESRIAQQRVTKVALAG